MTETSLFTRRRLEVFFAGQTLAIGLWLALPFDAMQGPAYQAVTAALHESRWGALFFFNGLCHILALLVNGHRWWSPLIRLFAAGTSVLAYGVLSGCFAFQDWQSTAVINYAAQSVGAGMCMFFAWHDARLALRLRYVAHHA